MAHAEERSVLDWLRRLRRDPADSSLGKRVAEQVRERLQQEVEPGEGAGAGAGAEDGSFLDQILPRDIESSLEEYVQQGEMEIQAGRIRITPRGGRRLAQLARRKLESQSRERSGLHHTPKPGCGWELDRSSRRYEPGDDYRFLDLQKSLLNALERRAMAGRSASLQPEAEDLEIHDRLDEARICLALLVDESASMGEEKREAAIDTCLALSQLKQPQDLLKVFIFSAQAREVPCWNLLNASAPRETTDIRLALQTVRRVLKPERGKKQIYLITDAEPNTENRQYIGFERAVPGVMREVVRCRQEGLTLNIVMLDDRPLLRDFASRLARFNVGRIYFASAADLGRVVVQDYLASRGRAHR